MQRVSLLKEVNVTTSAHTAPMKEMTCEHGWIPCSKDNMPREHEDVLVLYKGKRRIAELDWDIGQANANFEPYQYWGNPDRPGEEELEWEHVTHWQYLPPVIELQ